MYFVSVVQGSTPPFSRLYHVDVDEVRHFELVGACVAVFHRCEPNISFWNVLEQRTILCINVQEETRQLSEEFTVDNEEDADGIHLFHSWQEPVDRVIAYLVLRHNLI